MEGTWILVIRRLHSPGSVLKMLASISLVRLSILRMTESFTIERIKRIRKRKLNTHSSKVQLILHKDLTSTSETKRLKSRFSAISRPKQRPRILTRQLKSRTCRWNSATSTSLTSTASWTRSPLNLPPASRQAAAPTSIRLWRFRLRQAVAATRLRFARPDDSFLTLNIYQIKFSTCRTFSLIFFKWARPWLP